MFDSIYFPIMLFKDEDNCYIIPQFANGFNDVLLPSQVEEIIQGLISFTTIYCDEEIKEYNIQQKIRKKEEMYNVSTVKKQTKNNKGYVYVLECNNTYKVGFSKNVANRIRQLDTRPFELTLVTKGYSDRALDIEQETHKRLSGYRIKNEWYGNIDAVTIIKTINKVAEDLVCDIQF